MHEYSLIQSLVNEILSNSKNLKMLNSKTVNLGIGIFSDENLDNLVFWWDKLTSGTLLDGYSLVPTTIPGKIYCSNCSKDYDLIDYNKKNKSELINVIVCPTCGSLETQIINGAEVIILDNLYN